MRREVLAVGLAVGLLTLACEDEPLVQSTAVPEPTTTSVPIVVATLAPTATISPTTTPQSTVKLVTSDEPTATAVPPTSTTVPVPTDTPTPEPTSTSVPPTATPVPPTATSVPPTPTSIPPTATPVPPTPTPEPVLGSREYPVPLGVAAEVKFDELDHWEITVLDVQPNATEAVLAENPYNDPPGDGNQFYMVTLRAKYLGPDSTHFQGSFRLRTVGVGGVVYTTFENSCGVIPNWIPDPELFTNGEIEGTECWNIASSDADSLVLIVEPDFFSDRDRAWFALK